ncbi:MAG: TlpA family protein disulfide reductase [candidate division KSB1 bacterium]|nr:TlpA family protein disulfide reductase [candidate division KSB1 bacterium]
MGRFANVLIIVSCFSFSPGLTQDWLMEYLKGGMSNPNDLVASLRNEMKKAIGSKAPSFSFQRIESDSSETLHNYTGRTVIVNLWHTNCSGCRMQLPELSRLQKEYARRGLSVIYISHENKETLINFFSKNNTEGVKATMSTKQLSRPYQLLATPSAFVVDPEGVVREVWIGPEKYEALERHILPYLPTKM